jgi:tetratricopeptide (TPR) repeat protein
MTAWRRILVALIGIELLVAFVLIGLRLGSTRVLPPLVDQYNDSQTGRELLALPDPFLFDSAAKWRTLGEAYQAFGYFAKADSCLARAVAADPGATEAALAHGFVLERLGRIEDAIDVFERTARSARGPLAQMAWHHLGRNHLRLEQADQALAAFEQAGDDHDPSVYQRAKWLIRAGRAGEARELLDSLSENFGNDLHVLYLVGMAAEQLGQVEEALAVRDRLDLADSRLEIDDLDELFKPYRARFGLARGIAAAAKQQRGDLRGAAETMEQLVRDDPLWQNSYLLLLQDVAQIQLKAGRPEVAGQCADQQIRKLGFPTAGMWEVAADVARARGEDDESRRALAHAERMLPSAIQYFKLAELAQKSGDDEGYRRNLSLSKLLDARMLHRARQLDDAQIRVREALKLDPEMADGWCLLGEICRRLNQTGPARSAFRRCLELDPNHGRAEEQSRRLSARSQQTEPRPR